MSKELEYGKWYPIEEYFKNIKQMDWALVQFKETKSGFMGLPHIAELRNNKWCLECDDEGSYVKYINEDCEPIAFMLWQPYEEIEEVSKKLKRELFNIYDVVVFEDENGITQDCVCAITKGEKEIDEVVSVIECNNYSISIYRNGNYKVWEKDGKDLPYYLPHCSTNKKIIHLYTLKNDNRFYEVYPTNDYKVMENAKTSEALETIKTLRTVNQREFDNDKSINKSLDIIEQALQHLEAIDNANPSEALRKLDDISYLVLNEIDDLKTKELWKSYFNTIKQSLIKAQEKEELLDYITRFIVNVNISDNGIYYVSFDNNTPYLDCIEIDKEHYNKFKKIKEF